jgi:hypothetical protein
MKTAVLDQQEAEKLSVIIDRALREMAGLRAENRRNNAEIAKLRDSTRERLKKIRQNSEHAKAIH